MARNKRKFSIRFTVGSMFLLATTITALFAISLQYYFSRAMSEEHVLAKLSVASAGVSEYVKELHTSAESSATLMRSVSTIAKNKLSEAEIRSLLTQVLRDNPLFYSIYLGYENEDFYQIINLDSAPIVRTKMEAGDNERWVVIRISGEKSDRKRENIYYTDDFEQTRIQIQSSNFFPSQRPWFDGATSESVFKTEPYLFKHLKITGQTYSIRGEAAVLGIDIVLSSISSKITPESMGLANNAGVESYLFSPSGEVIASGNSGADGALAFTVPKLAFTSEQKALLASTRPLLVSNQNDWEPIDFSAAGQPMGYMVDVLKLVGEMTGLRFEFINGFSSQELVQRFSQLELDILLSVPVIHTPLGMTSQGMLYQPVARASLSASVTSNNPPVTAVIAGRGIHHLLDGQSIKLVEDLTEAMELLQAGMVDNIMDFHAPLLRLRNQYPQLNVTPVPELPPVQVGLVMHQADKPLLDIVNLALLAIPPETYKKLADKWLNNSAKKHNQIPYTELIEQAQNQPGTMVTREVNGEERVFYATSLGSELFAVVVPQSVLMAQVYPKLVQSVTLTLFVMLLFIPLAWKFGSPIVHPVTLLRRETRKIKARQYDQVCPVDTRIKEVWDLSESMIEMSKEIQRYQKSQEEFVESFIRLIAQAIDDKSPYTAGHCNRVPELGMMLAKAAEMSDKGPFKEFEFASDEERREFRIAAWLHDCGKITTPEHIVDKGTKLETIYNRIHEIRTRFEVLLRDAHIRYLEERLKGEQPEPVLYEAFEQRQRELQKQFAFIAEANVGSEFMSDEAVEAIQQIGAQTWTRHFDDRLGLSPFEELAKYERPLPAEEKLLSDKPDHIVLREHHNLYDPKFGIKMEMPEYLYNRGELYNLSIRRGTLTPEDRYKINEHMLSGIKILDELPFPPELANVPRYATTHHETLKGTGYPRKLSAEDLSVPERILVIADIFEALTAADRPYKKAKPISVAIDILYKMALDEHVDMELFKLFLESGTYLAYAERFLPPEQMDDVDIEKYLRPSLTEEIDKSDSEELVDEKELVTR